MDVAFWTMISALGTFLAPIGAVGVGVWAYAKGREAERDAKRRDEMVRFLVTAYEDLENSAHRDPLPFDQLERAVARIQLLGTASQAEEARRFSREFAESGSAGMGPLLARLRQALRHELGLERDDSTPVHLRCSANRPVRPGPVAVPKPN